MKQNWKKYNSELAEYYTARTGSPQYWQAAINKTLNTSVRKHIQPFFQKQGLLKR